MEFKEREQADVLSGGKEEGRGCWLYGTEITGTLARGGPWCETTAGQE